MWKSLVTVRGYPVSPAQLAVPEPVSKIRLSHMSQEQSVSAPPTLLLSLFFPLRCDPWICSICSVFSLPEEEINNMKSELEKYGIQMPAFSKIGGILANELSVDEAACKQGLGCRGRGRALRASNKCFNETDAFLPIRLRIIPTQEFRTFDCWLSKKPSACLCLLQSSPKPTWHHCVRRHLYSHRQSETNTSRLWILPINDFLNGDMIDKDLLMSDVFTVSYITPVEKWLHLVSCGSKDIILTAW